MSHTKFFFLTLILSIMTGGLALIPLIVLWIVWVMQKNKQPISH